MAIIQIDGIGNVEVGANFLSLPPDRQAAEVEAIAASIKPPPATTTAAPAEQPTDLVSRSSLLPIGKTREGKLTPALPEFAAGPVQTIIDILDGKRTAQEVSGKEIFEMGMLLGGGSSANATGAGIARTAAKATPEELRALSGPGVPGLRPTPAPAVAAESPAAVAPGLAPAAAVETAAPAAKPGFTRFYHGGDPASDPSGGGGRWVTPDPKYAQGKAGDSGQVFYVDVPNNSPLLVKAYDDTGSSWAAPFVSFEAPPEIAKNLLPLGSSTPSAAPPVAAAGSVAARPAVAEVAPKTPAEAKALSKSFYKQAEDAGVVISPKSFQPLAADVFKSAEKAGMDPTLTPDSVAAVKRIVDLARGPKRAGPAPITFEKLDLMRQIASDAQGAVKPSDRRVAGIIVDKIDDFIAKMTDKDVISGDPKIAAEMIPKARELWSKASKLEAVDRLVERAKTSSPNFSASGMENALRTEFRHLAKNDGAMRRFTPEERDAIKKVARGTKTGNTARNVGRAAPTGPVSFFTTTGVGGAIGSALLGPGLGTMVGVGTAAAIGYSARHLATVLTRRNVAQLEQAILKGGDSAMAKAALARGRRQLSLLEAAAANSAPVAVSSGADAQTKRRK